MGAAGVLGGATLSRLDLPAQARGLSETPQPLMALGDEDSEHAWIRSKHDFLLSWMRW